MPSQDEKLLAAVSHLAILFHVLGLVIVILIYLMKKDQSEFVADQAKQALGYQIAVRVLGLLGPMLLGGGVFVGQYLRSPSISELAFIPFIMFVFGSLALLAYGIYAAVCAYRGQRFRYVLIGDFVAGL